MFPLLRTLLPFHKLKQTNKNPGKNVLFGPSDLGYKHIHLSFQCHDSLT